MVPRRDVGVNWADAVAGSLPAYLSIRALLPPYWIAVPYTEYLGYVPVSSVVNTGVPVRGLTRRKAPGSIPSRPIV